jgi:hypothetical protein
MTCRLIRFQTPPAWLLLFAAFEASLSRSNRELGRHLAASTTYRFQQLRHTFDETQTCSSRKGGQVCYPVNAGLTNDLLGVWLVASSR